MGNRVAYLPAYEAEVEYLETDGDSYIDTGLKASSELGVLAHIQNSQDVTSFLFGGCDERNNNEFAFIGLSDAGNSIYRFGTGSIDGAKLDADIIYEFDNTQSHNIMEVGNLTYTAPTTTFESSYNLILFGENRRGVRQKSIGVRIYDFKIYSGSTLVRDFIPVRIGTTGYMYDKVSRQLFANAGTGMFVLGNDVANATVPQLRHVVFFGEQRCVGFEKVYEKCAWLKGRNGAYINTNYIPLHSDSISCHYRYDGVKRNPDGEEQEIFGIYQVVSDGVIYRLRAYINGNNHLSVQFYLNINNFPSTGEHITNADITDLHIEGGNFYFCVNGVQFSSPTNLDGATMVFNKSIWLFGYNVGGTTAKSYFHGDIAYFRITDPTFSINRINMFPCRLLVDIPAILDGNGIARQAGACGMWDTVSGRFFGNVADRGTFDVVYFEEGVDYEVHDWLQVSVSAKADMAGLPVNSPNLYFKHKHISGINYHYFRTTGEGVDYDYFYEADAYRCSIWNLSNKTAVYRTSDITEDEIVINCNSSNRYVNGYDIPIYGSTIKQVSIISRNQNGFEGLISSITVDGIERYIPVKLLRSIPPRHDANGIARNAGECGMYDTVNDLFYGNVASSGVFSVSDD